MLALLVISRLTGATAVAPPFVVKVTIRLGSVLDVLLLEISVNLPTPSALVISTVYFEDGASAGIFTVNWVFAAFQDKVYSILPALAPLNVTLMSWYRQEPARPLF